MLIKVPSTSINERRSAMEQEQQRVLKLQSLDTGVEMWSGGFGDDYTDRNQVDWQKRIPIWRYLIGRTGARSVFEMGCNAGWNLSAILRCYPDVQVTGNDINTRACEQAQKAGLNAVNVLDFKLLPSKYELTFTAGVLIHIEPEHLQEVMTALVAKSYRWVLAIEYAAEQEEQVEYRGHVDKCWRRPYGALYQQMGLKLVDSNDLNAEDGFDRCKFWLLEK